MRLHVKLSFLNDACSSCNLKSKFLIRKKEILCKVTELLVSRAMQSVWLFSGLCVRKILWTVVGGMTSLVCKSLPDLVPFDRAK